MSDSTPAASATHASSAPRADAAYSRFVQRVRRRYSAELALLPPGAPDRAAIAALVNTLQQQGRPPSMDP